MMKVQSEFGAIKSEFDVAKKRLDALVRGLTERINALPDNPNIRRLSSNCFVVSSRHLGGNWLPEHHDFKRQYRAVAQIITTGNPAEAPDKLQKIIEAGKIPMWGASLVPLRLHPDVIRFLRELLEA